MTTTRALICWLTVASAILVHGCGDDSGEESGAPDAGPMLTDTPTPTSPATTQPPATEMPATTEPSPAPMVMVDEDAGVEDGAGDQEPTPVVLPSDGEALSVCASDDECNGDDLACLVLGTYQGYCTDDCDTDEDCPDIDGIASTCASDGRCIVDCELDGEPDGACPQHMQCAQVAGLLTNSYLCQYPEPKDRDLYETCDGLRGDADCMEGLTCDVFVGLPLLSELAEPYCAEVCNEDEECSDPGGGATPVCDRDSILVSEGLCALQCDNDKQCPGDMLCVAIDPLQRRCGYPL